MKNKIPTKAKYNQGGQILGGIQQLAPLLNLAIPGLGTGVGAMAGLGAGYLNAQEAKQKQAEAAMLNPANYSNQNAFGYNSGGMIGPEDPKKKNTITPTDLWKNKGKILDIIDVGADVTDAVGIMGGVGAAPFNRVLGPVQAARSIKNRQPLKAMFDIVPMNSLWMPEFMDKALSNKEANEGVISAFKSIPSAAGVFRDNVKKSFGFESGGMLQGLASGAGLVTGAPNQVDGNNLNYKGQNIQLDHGETLDTNKDRVISDKYFNPVTGKKIVDEDKALKRSRGKAEKKLERGSDIAAANTIKYTQQREDALFNLQEQIAQMSGDRNRPQDQPMQQGSAGYVDGGPIKGSPQWYAQQAANQLSQPIGLPQYNPINNLYNVFSDSPSNQYTYKDAMIDPAKYWGSNFDVKQGKRAYNAMIQKQNLMNKGVKDYKPVSLLKDNNVYDSSAHAALYDSQLGKTLFSNESQFANRVSPDKKTLYSFTPSGVTGSPVKYTSDTPVEPTTMPDGTPFNPLSGLYGTASSVAGNMNQNQLDAIGQEGFLPAQGQTLSENEAAQLAGQESVSGNNPNFWSQATMGEKTSMGALGASLLAKGIESFQPLQQQAYRPNTAPITLTQLDPSAQLNRNQQSYESALNNAQRSGNTANQSASMQQALFANRLNADNQAMSQYQGQNASLKDNYEQRLAQRMGENNANMNQVDDIMARRRGARENMRMGVYGDVASLGMGVGSMMNNRLSSQAILGLQSTLAPDVWKNYVSKMTPEMRKYYNITQ